MNLQELQTMAAGIKNETRVGGNTAQRIGKAFECVADVIQQGVDDATIKLDDLNVFPTTPQEAINFVKNNGKKAVLTIVDRDFSVGVLSIFADAQAEVLTEVFETRLTLDGGSFIKGYGYGCPKRYWRNYGIKQAYNGGAVKKQEWTDWKNCEDDTEIAQHSKKLIEIYNGSPNGEQRDLQDVVNELNGQLKKCLYISFIDEAGERVLYYCNSGTFSSDISDWKKLGNTKVKPTLLPFSSIVENAKVWAGTAMSGNIVWDKAKKKFLCFNKNTYFSSWKNAEDYGETEMDGVTPRTGVLYFNSAGEAYTWNGTKMIPFINGRDI